MKVPKTVENTVNLLAALVVSLVTITVVGVVFFLIGVQSGWWWIGPVTLITFGLACMWLGRKWL